MIMLMLLLLLGVKDRLILHIWHFICGKVSPTILAFYPYIQQFRKDPMEQIPAVPMLFHAF